MAKPAPAKPAPKPEKSKRGGARPGSGRPRTKHLQQTISNKLIAKLESLAEQDLPAAISELVRGIFVETHTKTGKQIIYQQPPNAQMLIYVTDRILGKMTEKRELSGNLTTEVHVDAGKPRKPAVE